jgi:hypothetical protein
MGKAMSAMPPPPRKAAAAPVAVEPADELDVALATATATAEAQAASAPVSEVVVDGPLTGSGAVTDINEAPAAPAAKAAPKPVAAEVSVAVNSVIDSGGSLVMMQAINAALARGKADKPPVFKVGALQSGYTAEFRALEFADINRILASSLDNYAYRIKLLTTMYNMIQQFSCDRLSFDDWLKVSAQGDYDTLMYGLYGATYPGVNEFDIGCRHCGHSNKVACDINDLVRVENEDVYAKIRELLDPKTDFKGAIVNSLVGHTIQRELPESKMVVEIRNPSLRDYLDGTQWFVQVQDKNTGYLPTQMAGAEVTRTLTMYVQRILVPVPGGNTYMAITNQGDRASLIGRLSPVDGAALNEAVGNETKRLEVSYMLPAYNCAGCGKRNEDLMLDFEALLFIKLQEKR